MRLLLSAIVCIIAMLLTFRPLALDSVIQSVRARTPGLYKRIPNLSFHNVSQFSSYRNPTDQSVSNLSTPSLCENADRKAYRHILVDNDQQNFEYNFQLLMNIVKRPCLGHFVKRIEYVYQTNGDDYPGLPHQRNLSADDMRLLRRAVENAGFKDGKKDRIISMLMQNILVQDLGYTTPEGCRVGNWDISQTFITQAMAALFVSLSPNLETMAMTQPFSSHIYLEEEATWAIEYPLVQVFRYATSHPEGMHYLQKLRDVYLINKSRLFEWPEYYSYETDLIACLELFNKLPSIESFGIDALEEDHNNGKQMWEDGSSNITKIHINHSSLNSAYLLRVMATSKVITELQYTTGGRGSHDGGSPMFNPKAFIKGLSAHKETLKVLDIDTDQLTISYPGELWPKHNHVIDWDEYGGLKEFEPDTYWPEELNENNEEFKFHLYLVSIWNCDASLKDFVALKELSIHIGFLIYFAQGVETDDAKRRSIMLVDSLPDSLESLTIRGYQKGVNQQHDAEVAALMAKFESGSLRLKEIKGVDQLIPNGYSLENPEEEEHLVWSLEERGYAED